MLEEVHALHELHREQPQPALADQLVEGDQVRMHDVGERAELALESVQGRRVPAPQDLQRDDGARLAVERLVHHAEAAGAQPPLDLEAVAAGERVRMRLAQRPFPTGPPPCGR